MEVGEDDSGADTSASVLVEAGKSFIMGSPHDGISLSDSNANLITDDRDRAPACKPTEEVKEEIEDKFNTNLYRDVGDVFNKSHGQLIFHTMPSTTIQNEQTKFAKWLYKTGPTCKERTIDCTTQW